MKINVGVGVGMKCRGTNSKHGTPKAHCVVNKGERSVTGWGGAGVRSGHRQPRPWKSRAGRADFTVNGKLPKGFTQRGGL